MGVTLGLIGGQFRFDFEDAGGGVSTEQGPLGPAQDLDTVDVKDRKPAQSRVLEDDIVHDGRDRLRRVQVEVWVAQASHVNPRIRPAERGFDEKTRHPHREKSKVLAAGSQVTRSGAVDTGDGCRNGLQVLFPLSGGDRDVLEPHELNQVELFAALEVRFGQVFVRLGGVLRDRGTERRPDGKE